MSEIIHQTLFQALEKWAPKSFAYDWDNVGLQVGSKTHVTKNVLVTLDVNDEVVDEAIENGVNVIIAHHPMLFKPLKSIDYNSVKGSLIRKLIKHDITVYASHTNLDVAEGGVNDLLSDALELENVKPLLTTHIEPLIKLAVFTPVDYVQQVVDALSEAGAGHIGNYSHCTFQSAGTGTFKPLEGANPYIGSTNKLEHVDELKIETIVPEPIIDKVVNAMLAAHPYEEVAYDLYPLKNKGKTYGIGRVGLLSQTMKLEQLIHKVKKQLNVNHLRFTGNLTKEVKRVAILGGSGEKFIEAAKNANCDVYITGDITFHHAQDAKELNIALIDAGHYIEQIMKEATKQYIENKFPTLKVIVSKVNTDPFQFL